MKKQFQKMAIIMAILMSISGTVFSQIYVKIRPTFTVKARPEPPRQHVVWVGEDWRVNNGQYEYYGDRWIDERNGYTWVPGHWKKYGRRGERWVPGHWRRN